jgi:hypothetical protein
MHDVVLLVSLQYDTIKPTHSVQIGILLTQITCCNTNQPYRLFLVKNAVLIAQVQRLNTADYSIMHRTFMQFLIFVVFIPLYSL